jgi:hypothetical protein
MSNIVAFVGTIDEDESALPITGNGKTVGMTGYGYIDFLAGREIWSNYETDFSSKVMRFQEMVEIIIERAKNDEHSPNLILLVTEMRKILDAIGSNTEQVLYINEFTEQIRKIGCTLYYDTQRFMSIHKRLRIDTNIILIPYKTHFDENPCYLPSCMKPHKIYIFSHKPDIEGARKCFNAAVVGKHFDSLKFSNDKLILTKPTIEERFRKKREAVENGS